MRAVKRPSRSVRTRSGLEDEPGTTTSQHGREPAAESHDIDDLRDGAGEPAESDEDVLEIFRVHCPDCARPIALLAEEDVLPEHALCPSPWNPFGLTVCSGSGRFVADAEPIDGAEGTEQDVAVLLTLPAGLDWRTQPFSHAGGPGSRPIRTPELRSRR